MNKGYIDVRCSEALNSGISVDEEFSVTTDAVSSKGVPEMKVDDNIRVVFNGEIRKVTHYNWEQFMQFIF